VVKERSLGFSERSRLRLDPVGHESEATGRATGGRTACWASVPE
jgi:hypothetical protein